MINSKLMKVERASKAILELMDRLLHEDKVPKEAILMAMTEFVVIGWQMEVGDEWQETFIELSNLMVNRMKREDEEEDNARN